jgi:hypothetical protein
MRALRVHFVVTRLLTITIKVNIPGAAESQSNNGVTEMKKVKTGRGFWSWILGCGWDSGGSGG